MRNFDNFVLKKHPGFILFNSSMTTYSERNTFLADLYAKYLRQFSLLDASMSKATRSHCSFCL